MKFQKKHYILYGIITAIILGFITGGLFPEAAVNFKLLGEIFLNLLMMIVIPLVILSIMVGITNLGDVRHIGSIGRRTIFYYIATTCLSVLAGLILVNIIQPGKDIKPGEKHTLMPYTVSSHDSRTVIFQKKLNRASYSDKYTITLLDQQITGTIKSVSGNKLTVTKWQPLGRKNTYELVTTSGNYLLVKKGKTMQPINITPKHSGTGIDISLALAGKIKGKENRTLSDTIHEVIIGNKKTGKEGMIPRNIFNAMQRMEILPLIFFAILLGMALSVLGEKGKQAIELISTFNDAVMKLVDWIMLIAPFGIFGIIAARIGEAGGFSGFWPELVAVGKYSLTVILGLSFHAFITLPLILFFIGKRNPLLFLKGLAPALLNAFSTASSSATLPLSIEAVERQNNISNRTASFVLPLGATINMDGTALYEAVAAIFISQVYGIHLGPAEQIVIFLTATLAAIGAAGIPEAGLVTMVIVLKAVGLPIEGIGLILTIDWLLDRFRTTVNVWGDCSGCGVVETLENKAGG